MEIKLNCENLKKLNLTIPELAFLTYQTKYLKRFSTDYARFDAKETAEILGYSESWAREMFRKFKKRGVIKIFNKYFTIIGKENYL